MLSFTKFIFLFIPVLIGVAFLTLLERKILSLVGSRLGPNKVSFIGLFQPMGDALKLSNKQINLMSSYSFFFYYLSSSFMMIMALISWIVVPSCVSLKFSIIILFLILGFNCLNSILSGWSTFGKYSLIGSLRTVSQLISYEAVIYLCVFFIVFVYSSFYFSFFFFPLNLLVLSCPLVFLLWVPSFLSELNRTPFDFSEGESELVSGFNTDFGSISFTLIFLAEYSSIMFFCMFSVFMFFMGFEYFFLINFFFVIWVRSVLPRFRFDKLMFLAWKFMIPFLTVYFVWFIIEIFLH